jgi:hypothetical protein
MFVPVEIERKGKKARDGKLGCGGMPGMDEEGDIGEAP